MHVKNEAIHLHPYVAFVWTPREKLFFESFTQLDVTTKGNRVSLEDLSLATTETLGRLSSSRILFVDAMAGYWWYYADPCRRIHSLASLVEVHYVTALDSGESLEGNALGGEYFFCNGAVHNGGYRYGKSYFGTARRMRPLFSVSRRWRFSNHRRSTLLQRVDLPVESSFVGECRFACESTSYTQGLVALPNQFLASSRLLFGGPATLGASLHRQPSRSRGPLGESADGVRSGCVIHKARKSRYSTWFPKPPIKHDSNHRKYESWPMK